MITLDGCASRGTVLKNSLEPGADLPFVSRYHETGGHWVNVLNYPFQAREKSVTWIFPPRKIQSLLLRKILDTPTRNAILFLLMWHAELPVHYNILEKNSVKHIVYTGTGLFLRPSKSKRSFVPYSGPRAIVFLLPCI